MAVICLLCFSRATLNGPVLEDCPRTSAMLRQPHLSNSRQHGTQWPRDAKNKLIFKPQTGFSALAMAWAQIGNDMDK